MLGDLSVINYPELICASCWFIFVFIIENARSKKQKNDSKDIIIIIIIIIITAATTATATTIEFSHFSLL